MFLINGSFYFCDMVNFATNVKILAVEWLTLLQMAIFPLQND